nr:16S rRNA (cytidine(1402)-2'-O)-methyltransferase [Bacilli bacterium]
MGNLYVVSVPIGNTKDISYNAVETLKNVDIIACEDTRVSGLLLKEYNIKSKLVSYHKFNENNKSDFLIDELKSGKNIAIISDAGTPCINDPGTYIIKKAIDNNINVIANPGASAVITALSISGFDITTFTYLGFIPRVKKEIDDVLDSIKDSKYELFVFYESPKRIKNSLEIINEKLENPEVCLCNDLTKIHQRIYRGKTIDVLNELNGNPNSEKGEYVLIIKYKSDTIKGNVALSNEALLVNTMVENNCSMKEAINICKDAYKINKNDLYDASLNVKKII